ncbi:MAG: hypothetical protein E7424_04145 [Ruminococcaceae bacterium]|nr:hypothetical protein [Oscillospiraceae bacterium]
MTAQDLKNAILQLAVQGKLVPQNPNDEPVSELLKRIKAEKERQVKGGKIKKEKPLDPISGDEIPFDIPESWEWVKIGYLFTIVRGITFPSEAKKKTPSSDLVPCATTGSVQNQYNSNADVFVSPEYVKRDDQWLLPRDIIMSTANSRELVGKTCIWNESERKTFGGFLTVLRPDNCVYPAFAYYALMSIKASGAFLKNATQTTNIANINTQVLSNTTFPLPPLAEQQRIVAKIEELMPLVEEYGKAEERLTALNAEFPDKLRKSILQQAIQGKLTERDPADEPASELLKRIRAERQQMQKDKKAKKSQATETIDEDELTFDLPENWSWAKLGWLCQKIGAGSTPTGGAAVYVPHGIKFLREQNVHDDGLHLEGVAFIDEKTNNQKAGSIVQAQDILMNITGGSIGRNALVPDDFDIANVNQHVLIIRLVEKPLRHYLHLCLCAPFVLNQMFSKQIGDKPGLSATKVENFVIPLPPLAEQQRIVDRVNELLAVCDELK